MGRPREFKIDKAVADAMAVFWMHGYEDASLPHLLEGTGLSRGSLYKAFEGKQSLFIAALRCYADLEVTPAAKTLGDATREDGLDRIRALFMNIPATVRAGDARGCLLCSAAAGRAAQEPEIAEVIYDLLHDLETGFDLALSAAGIKRNGTAYMLVAHYIGLRTLSRSGARADVLEKSVMALMAMISAKNLYRQN